MNKYINDSRGLTECDLLLILFDGLTVSAVSLRNEVRLEDNDKKQFCDQLHCYRDIISPGMLLMYQKTVQCNLS